MVGTPACREVIRLGEHTFSLYRSFPLAKSNAQIKRLVILVHGVNRNADEYFEWAMTAAEIAQASRDTLLIAPHFKNETDKKGNDELYWRGSQWKAGDPSINAGGKISAFSIVDTIASEVVGSKNFPGLRKLVITGHSAGGQLTSRYAVTSSVAESLGLEVSYVIGNPSTYFYVNPARWNNETKSFGIPDTDCGDYDDYPYGVLRPNPYVGGVSQADMGNSIVSRNIAVFVGEHDTDTELLDMSCGANLQGKNRYERGVLYHKYLRHFFDPAGLQLVVVPKMGHDGAKMYQSAEGRRLLFGSRE